MMYIETRETRSILVPFVFSPVQAKTVKITTLPFRSFWMKVKATSRDDSKYKVLDLIAVCLTQIATYFVTTEGTIENDDGDRMCLYDSGSPVTTDTV